MGSIVRSILIGTTALCVADLALGRKQMRRLARGSLAVCIAALTTGHLGCGSGGGGAPSGEGGFPDGGGGTGGTASSVGQRIAEDVGERSVSTVAVGADGTAMVIWTQDRFPTTRPTGRWLGSDVWASHYTPSSGWGPGEMIDVGDAVFSFGPAVEIDSQGNALAVWSQDAESGAPEEVWANRFTPAGGWGQAARISQAGPEDNVAPRLSLDDQGNALVVWVKRFGGFASRADVMSNRFTPTAGWAGPRKVGGPGPGSEVDNTFVAELAMDANGDAIVMWSRLFVGEDDSSFGELWWSRFSPTLGWSDAELLDDRTPNNPFVAMNDGRGFAVWAATDGAADFQLGRPYTVEGGWGDEDSPSQEDPVGPVAMGADGSVMMYGQLPTSLQATRYTPEGGWEDPVEVATERAERGGVGLEVGSDGTAILAWVGLNSDVLPENRTVATFSPESGWRAPRVVFAPEARLYRSLSQGFGFAADVDTRTAVHSWHEVSGIIEDPSGFQGEAVIDLYVLVEEEDRF